MSFVGDMLKYEPVPQGVPTQPRYIYDAAGNTIGVADSDGTVLPIKQSDGYFTHLHAFHNGNADDKFFDISGNLNDAARGANLSTATLWSVANHATGGDPAGVPDDVVLRMPALNFNYSGRNLAGAPTPELAESLLIFWKGRATPKATREAVIGDSPQASIPGIAVLCSLTTGTVQFWTSDGATLQFSTTTVGVGFSATVDNSVCVALDGRNKRYSIFINGVATELANVDYAYAGDVDTRTTDSFNLGTAAANTASKSGVIASTQALAVLRGRAGKGLPVNLSALVAKLHKNPTQLVTSLDW